MIDFYPEFTNLCEETLRNGRQMEQAALSSCRLAIFASEWAAKTAVENYNVDNSKVKVVPFGANLAPIPDADKVQRAIASRGSGVCKLLFVGVDWHRKGGDKALAVTSMLNQRGLKAELHVVGCTPPSLLPGSSRTYGYLSKNNDKQKELLSRLYLESDFLILPSEAESFGIVIAEANAFGLPALTTNVGGIGTVVRNGKNGRAFEARCFVQECTEYILQNVFFEGTVSSIVRIFLRGIFKTIELGMSGTIRLAFNDFGRTNAEPRIILKMNILLSAYGCDPFRGSEGSIGWNWAYELARAGHRVWVITAPFGKESIEEVLASTSIPTLTVIYVDLPYVPTWFGLYRATVHGLLWQRRALSVARDLNSKVEFDIVHHVTLGSLHIGSPLWRLGKPFIFGPVGGGQVAPRGFGRYLRGGRTIEFLRSVVVRYFTGTLFYAKSTVTHAKLILVANYETHAWADRLGAERVENMLDIGTPKQFLIEPAAKQRSDLKTLKILWCGRLIPRKGVLLALEALAQVDHSVPFTCTIIGDGRQGRYLPGWINELGLADRVVWKGEVPWSEALAAYLNHDVLLFTSLRDTVGIQLVEAMARGNAIVALDHQGAKLAVPNNAGIMVPVTTPGETRAKLARAIERLANEPETLVAMSRNAIEAAACQTWAGKVERAIRLYGLICRNKNSASA